MNDRQARETVVTLRRKIHQHPELGQREFRTTALVTGTLGRAKIPFRRCRPTGAVAHLRGAGPGPCVALRADMDALPLTELANVPFKSKTPGVMHACGHDGHTAMLLTAALRLKSRGLKAPGTVKFFFQPDEEGSGGARSLIRHGAMRAPRVDAVFGLHVNPRFPAGTLCIRPGALMAAVDRFTIEIFGEGGHGAYPHEGKDAVVIAAQTVNALQSIVARRVDPVESVVLTVGTIHGGQRFNILADKVTLTGTVRTLSPVWHRKIPRMIHEVVSGTVRAQGGRHRIVYENLSKPVVNDARMADLARDVAEETLGRRRVVDLARPSMGGEDFSEYLDHAPGCFIYVGTGAGPRTRKPWHHPAFFLHEPSLMTGVNFLSALAPAVLQRLA